MAELQPICFRLLRDTARLPHRATPASGAFDVFVPEAGSIEPGERKLIGLGIAHEIPEQLDINLIEAEDEAITLPMVFQGLIIARSGLAAKYGVKPYFDPCLIDHDYRGEIKLLLYNGGERTFNWEQGERLCQIAYVPFYMGGIREASNLNETERGHGGFGSTGR